MSRCKVRDGEGKTCGGSLGPGGKGDLLISSSCLETGKRVCEVPAVSRRLALSAAGTWRALSARFWHCDLFTVYLLSTYLLLILPRFIYCFILREPTPRTVQCESCPNTHFHLQSHYPHCYDTKLARVQNQNKNPVPS